ncbi:MAG: restriction endonuclease subunit S [Pseudobutyrivibrio sp.]|nr:restriction endonuclease subunit S [Pseudobutyrivibrio sp.]
MQDDVNKDKEKYRKYTVIHPNDIAINGLNLNYDFVSQRVASVKNKGIMTSAYLFFTPRRIEEQKYLIYLLKGYDGIKLFHGIGSGLRQTLTADEVLKLQLPVPPKPEQDQIVRYLDWKTSEIDRFIHQKKKQIKRLEEYKFTRMDELVTKGLDKTVPMKDSEVEWLGYVPAHWNVHTIKQHFQIRKRIAGREGFDVLSITQQGLKVKDIASNEGQMAQNYSGYQFVYPGDFAMNHMDLITGYVDLSDKFGVTSPDYRVFSLVDTENCYPEFYLRVFQIGYKRRTFYKFGKGAANQGRWRLPQRAFYNYSIQVPPIEEQVAIEKECVVLEKQADEMIDALHKEIELLQELRTKIIADVVTGQIDVRDEIIPEYNNTEDIEPDDELENEDDSEEESEAEE